MTLVLDRITTYDPTLDEHDSHYFLKNLVQQGWYCYSSKEISIDDVVSAIETYILLHATVSIPDKGIAKFWTPNPINVLKYVMDSDGNWHDISLYKPFDGYLVQAAVWSNGFYYLVSYKDFLIEANLYIDFQTKEQYNYL